MGEITLIDVTPNTLPELEQVLRSLAEELNDPFKIKTATLHAALFGKNPAGHGALAYSASGTLVGAAMYSPVISTAFGTPGVYVSDLWVAETARGQGTGRTLLAYVSGRAKRIWAAEFIKLAVYRDNKAAQEFYQKLGFTGHIDDIILSINSDDLGPVSEMN